MSVIIKMSFFILLLLIKSPLLSAQEVIIKGTYHGKNLYVLNTSIDVEMDIYCVNAVYVNNILTNDETKSNSFEIDFANLNLNIGDKVTVKITHKPDCKPEVINANVLESSIDFTITSPKMDKKTLKMNWSINGIIDNSPFIVEQYRWDKWITIGEVKVKDSITANNFEAEVKFHSKNNTFRVRHIDKTGTERVSKECKYFNKDEELYLLSTRISDWLYFSGETIFEIYDEKGNFILDGYGKEVNISDLEKGKYFVNYDNRTEVINKR